jgi:hypothetical protein
MSEHATRTDLAKSELRAAATFATIRDLNEVRTEMRGTFRELGEIKAELRSIHQLLDYVNSNVERVMWLVLTVVVGAILKQVLGL